MTSSITAVLKSSLLALMTVAVLFAAPEGKAPSSNTKKQESSQKEAAQSSQSKININTAGLEELTKLPRIGPVTAQRILDFRKEHGGFKKAEELMNVQGIGPKTFARLQDLIQIQ